MICPKINKSCFIIIFSVFFSSNAFSQLTVTPSASAAILASTLAGPGVTILSPTFTCPAVANGTFTAAGTLLAMSNGIILTNGHSAACVGPYGAPPGTASFNDGAAGDPAMVPYEPPTTPTADTTTYDACILEFNVVASGDTVGFNYQFGSQEYYHSICGVYSDIFGFFISGPGITGAPNIALVPGTNIPVEVNSVNDGIVGTSAGATISNCTSLGAGSPFTAYYINNTGGTQLSYTGYTTKFRAFHSVTPCDTYHLKLCIVDVGNALYDLGVFLEAGSLTSNTYAFNHADSIGVTIGGIPHTIVKGCSPTTVNIIAAHSNTTPTVLNLSFGGTAVNGVDVTTIPNTVTLPAGSTSVGINIQGIPTLPGGSKTLVIYLDGSCGILDSVAINIMDTPSVHILTADTSVCLGQSFEIIVSGTEDLTYSWAPPTGLSSTTTMEPICTPAANTIYTLTATLPGSGCPAIERTIAVNIGSAEVNILTPDTTICEGASVNILVSGSGASTYSWLPTTNLSNPDIEDPIATPSVTTTYTVSASSGIAGCTAYGTITITVANPSVTILTPDTTVCAGVPVTIRVDGSGALTYAWSPTAGLNNPNIIQPIATPSVTTTYFLTATSAGTPCVSTAEVTITIAPPLEVIASSMVLSCNTGINLSVTPTGTNYSYHWSGPSGFTDSIPTPYIANAVAADDGTYTVLVSDIASGCSGHDTTSVMIQPISVAQLTNITPTQTINYGSSVQLNVDNATYYWWMPDDGTLNNRNINDPIATPTQSTVYTVYGVDTATGCTDSLKVLVNVIFDSITIPSAFTPNGDGLNDIFRPLGMKYQSLVQFSVYNRWGQQVFSTNNKEQGWDGTFNGVKQDMDVYNYMLIVAMDDGTNRFFKGTVTLIR